MDQDQRKEAILGKVEARIPLTPLEVAPELAVMDADAFKLRAYNWSADRFRKIFCLLQTFQEPSLDTLNVIMYPDTSYDAPIFLSFFLMTGNKVMVHFNVYTPLDDEAYKAKWVEPLNDILTTYPKFEGKGWYPDWMEPYRHPCAVHGMHSYEQLDDLTNCLLDYVEHYATNFAESEPVEDADTLGRIEAFHKRFITDIRTKDRAREMLKNFMDEDLIRRQFYEVTT